jgi:hypothetical protein
MPVVSHAYQRSIKAGITLGFIVPLFTFNAQEFHPVWVSILFKVEHSAISSQRPSRYGLFLLPDVVTFTPWKALIKNVCPNVPYRRLAC